MTQKQIDNARLLLRFMTTEPEVLENDLKKAGTLESTSYHDDYGWLMPVVEKIESLGYKADIFGNTTSIHDTEGKAVVDHPHQETKIGSIYEAVVAFCEGYPLISAPFSMESMTCTDQDRNQYGRKLSDGRYQFMEFDADAGEWVEMDILLAQYTDEQISNHIFAYYTSVEDVEKQYGEDAEWIIAECIFEQESGLY